jgi:hypothetical protein
MNIKNFLSRLLGRDIYSRFKAWVTTQSGAYAYSNRWDCAFARFLKQKEGLSRPYVTSESFSDSIYGDRIEIPPKVANALIQEPHTYEALAQRLKAA